MSENVTYPESLNVEPAILLPVASAEGGIISVMFRDQAMPDCNVTMTCKADADVRVYIDGLRYDFPVSASAVTVPKSLSGAPGEIAVIAVLYKQGAKIIPYITFKPVSEGTKATFMFPNDSGTQITIQIMNVVMS